MNHFLKFFVGLLLFLPFFGMVYGQQNNMGIGTTTPHPSAILHLDDAQKGFKIPYTDTSAVKAFSNSFVPASPIPNGLLIFQKGAENFFYYDKPLNKWMPLQGLQGPQGPKGDTGDAGPQGPPGHYSTMRSGNGGPVTMPGDTCDSYYIDMTNAFVYRFDCQFGWLTIGGPYKNRIIKGESVSLSCTSIDTGFEVGANSVSWTIINGLEYAVTAPVGYEALVFAHAHGTVSKVDTNSDYNYAKFDFYTKIPTLSKTDNWQVVSMGPTGPGPEFHNELTSWSISWAGSLGAGNTLVVRGGQAMRNKSDLGDIILADVPGSDNEAHMEIMIFYVRP